MILRTKSADDTREVAARIAGVARPRDVLLLSGDLGAGKTTFAQGFGRALGIEEAITSPTFTLIRQYEDGVRIPMLHADMYRLDQVQEVLDLGLAELVDEGRVALIEWGDAATPAVASDYLVVRIDFGEADDERRIDLSWVGPAWAARQAVLAEATAQWSADGDGSR